MSGAARFAGGDQAYLRDEQYADPSRLSQRADLHLRFGRSAVPWFEWVGSHLALEAGQQVLEVGCGSGALWDAVTDAVDLTLCDLSPGMVDSAVARAAAAGHVATVTGRPADAQALPFEESTFDRVVANHMLYHLPDPDRGVAELARVVCDDGIVLAATNGRGHMAELHEVEAAVFGSDALDLTVDVFGAEVGFAILREHFTEVSWIRYEDELRCTDPDAVLRYSCSSPPGEDANAAQRAALAAAIADRFEAGGGAMTITKDSGLFVCGRPRRAATGAR